MLVRCGGKLKVFSILLVRFSFWLYPNSRRKSSVSSYYPLRNGQSTVSSRFHISVAVLDISIFSIYNIFFLKEMRALASSRNQSSVMHLERLSKEIIVIEL